MSLYSDNTEIMNEPVDPNCLFVQDNAEAFALGSLTTTEFREITGHIALHPACRTYIDQAMATVETLAFAMPLMAAPDLAVKLSLFDRIAAESSQATLQSSKLERGNTLVAALQNTQAAPSDTRVSGTSRSWVQYLGAALLAPMAIALTVVSLWAFSMNDELDDMRDSTVVAEPTSDSSTSIEMMTMQSSGDTPYASGSLGAMPDQKSAVLMAWDLDPKKDHKVWCEESDGKQWMVGELVVSEDGNAMQTLEFPGPINDYTRIYVSGSGTDATESMELILMMPDKNKSYDEHDKESTPQS
ncbi:MAG: hypothetical protein WKF81_06125 [Thermomicrobiales bacterium]